MTVVIKFSTNELQNDRGLLSVPPNRTAAFYIDFIKMVVGAQRVLHKYLPNCMELSRVF